MTEPIDEAAAVAWHATQVSIGWPHRENAARAALRWKELADEHSEVCIIDLEAQKARASDLALELGKVQTERELWKARAEAAESEVRRQEQLVSDRDNYIDQMQAMDIRCEECNSELSACGVESIDGTPSMDCKVCQLRSELNDTRARLTRTVEQLEMLNSAIKISNPAGS